MRLGTQVSIFLGAALLGVSPLMAFGPEGHELVGVIATRHLCPEARREVNRFLAGETLGRAGNWPDWIRSQPEWRHTRPWHYINVGDDEPIIVGEDDVLWAIDAFERQLGDATLSRARRATALRFLAHFIADVHQPLHVGRAEDRGGNEITVRVNGRRTNLHAVWDAQALLRDALPEREDAGDLRVRALLALTAGEVGTLQADPPLDWAAESQALRAVVYTYGTPENGADIELDALYLATALDIVSLRLSQAGVRLAGRINGIFCLPASGP